jgi:hypothetical protein
MSKAVAEQNKILLKILFVIRFFLPSFRSWDADCSPVFSSPYCSQPNRLRCAVRGRELLARGPGAIDLAQPKYDRNQYRKQTQQVEVLSHRDMFHSGRSTW